MTNNTPKPTDGREMLKENIRKLYGIKKARYINFEPRLEQLMAEVDLYVEAKVAQVLEHVRLTLRGEDAEQYRPRDMVSMGLVEAALDAQLHLSKGKEGQTK